MTRRPYRPIANRCHYGNFSNRRVCPCPPCRAYRDTVDAQWTDREARLQTARRARATRIKEALSS